MMIDPMILSGYQIGIAMGVIIVTTLHLYYTNENGVANLQQQQEKQHDDVGNDTTLTTTSSPMTVSRASSPYVTNDSNTAIVKTTTTPSSSNPKTSDSIERQLNRTTAKSSVGRRNDNTNSNDSPYWTPHRQLNCMVYVILIGVTGIILRNEYSDSSDSNTVLLLVHYLKLYFPKEYTIIQRIIDSILSEQNDR